MLNYSDYSFNELCELKQSKQIDLSWQEIADIFDMNNGESARNKWKSIRRQNNKLPKKEDLIINNLEYKKMELYKEKVKLRDQKRELNKFLTKDARFESFLEEIKYSIDTLEVPEFYINDSLINGTKVGVLGISDIHFGKIYNSINNTYSIDVCLQRMELLLNEVINLISEKNISFLHIVNTGDSIEGLLRVSQIRVLELGVIDSVIYFSNMMAEWLNKLSAYIPVTYHHVKSANHTEVRWLNQSAGQFPDEDLEKVIVELITGRLINNKRVFIPSYNNDYVIFESNDKLIMGYHGHQFKNRKLLDLIKELNILHNIKIDYLILGHKHHEEIITVSESVNNNIKVIMLPAIMGSDNFSDQLFTGSKAGATLIELDSNRKGISVTEIILN